MATRGPARQKHGIKRLKQHGGGKLTRSETVTVRLDPKLRYLAELAARKQRRTLSSFIEWAIEECFGKIQLGEDSKTNLAAEAVDLWDVGEPDRFAKLALRYPSLLSHDEQILWKLVTENGWFWKDRDKSKINLRRFDEVWETLNAIVRGERDKGGIPVED